MTRISSHLIEDKAINYVKLKITDYFDNGDAIYRDLSGRDYGIDGLVELFDNGNPTGKISFIQVKGTRDKIEPLKTKPVISCSISVSNAHYATQNIIPVFLIYVSLLKPETLYFVNIQSAIAEQMEKFASQKSVTVHIPQMNSNENLKQFFDEIKQYYE